MFLVDESRIVAIHDEILSKDVVLKEHLSAINESLTLLADLPVAHADNTPDQVVLARLGIRLFNSGAAALNLIRRGYYQPALTMIRDLIEVYFLIDLFSQEPECVAQWRTMTDRQRDDNFKPVKVRERLDRRDGNTEQRRKAAYKLLSTHGAHVSPQGFGIISPDDLTQVGPFPDQGRFRALIEELVTHLVYGSVIFSNAIKSEAEDVLVVKYGFFTSLSPWQEKYLKAAK